MAGPRKRITARVSDKVRVTLEQAAELLGATVNQFVRLFRLQASDTTPPDRRPETRFITVLMRTQGRRPALLEDALTFFQGFLQSSGNFAGTHLTCSI